MSGRRRAAGAGASAGKAAAHTVRHLKRLAGEDAAAAEGARLEARDARLEPRLRRRSALLVPAASATAGEWGRVGAGTPGGAHVSFCSGASAMYSKSWGGSTSMLGLCTRATAP